MVREQEPDGDAAGASGRVPPVEGKVIDADDPVKRVKRRLVALQAVLLGASIVASIVLYSATGIGRALQRVDPLIGDVYAFVGILVPAGHAALIFLLTSGGDNAGRYLVRGTGVMIAVHLLWGGGLALGHWPALPVGIVLVAGDLLFLWWLRPVKKSLDTPSPLS